jgi:hypothetical protein
MVASKVDLMVETKVVSVATTVVKKVGYLVVVTKVETMVARLVAS